MPTTYQLVDAKKRFEEAFVLYGVEQCLTLTKIV